VPVILQTVYKVLAVIMSYPPLTVIITLHGRSLIYYSVLSNSRMK